MQRIFERMHIRIAFRGSLITLVALLLGTPSLWAHPVDYVCSDEFRT
jgi:hypothetical protein